MIQIIFDEEKDRREGYIDCCHIIIDDHGIKQQKVIRTETLYELLEKTKEHKKQGLIQNEIQVLCPSDPKQLFLQPFSKRVIISNLNVILIKTDDEKTFFHQPVDLAGMLLLLGSCKEDELPVSGEGTWQTTNCRPAGRNGL